MRTKTIFSAVVLDLILVACDGCSSLSQKQKDQPDSAHATDGNEPDLTLQAAIRTEVIDGALRSLNDSYVFPEVAKQMEKAVRGRKQRQEYDKITSAKSFAKVLTAHLQEVSHDKHLVVLYSHEIVPDANASGPRREEQEKQRHYVLSNNFGFEKVERLLGNTGYLDLRLFIPPEESSETAAAAMNFLVNTNALIVDVRQCPGGNSAMVAFLSSYLFESEPVHLNDIYWRPTNTTFQSWTRRQVPGKRYGNKPVYVLTSPDTLSAGEEFAYNLKSLKRATLVGETTGGGANPSAPHRINDHFVVGVPSGSAINPITKTNWEGTGVKPDIEVPKEMALKTAHVRALRKVLETNSNPFNTGELKKSIATAEKELEEMRKR